MPFPCVVSLYLSICVCCFHYSSCLCFSVYILSLCMPLTLFPFHYFVTIIFIQQLVPLHIPCRPFCSPFLAMIVVSILPLIRTPFFLSHLVFLLYFVFIVIPFIPFMPFVFYFSLWYYLYHLFALSFFHFYYPTDQCCFTKDLVALISVPFLSFIYLISFATFLLLSYHQYSAPNASPSSLLLSCSFSFLYLLVVLATYLLNGNENSQDSKVSGKVHVPSPPYPFLHSGKMNTRACHCWRQRYLVCQ